MYMVHGSHLKCLMLVEKSFFQILWASFYHSFPELKFVLALKSKNKHTHKILSISHKHKEYVKEPKCDCLREISLMFNEKISVVFYGCDGQHRKRCLRAVMTSCVLIACSYISPPHILILVSRTCRRVMCNRNRSALDARAENSFSNYRREAGFNIPVAIVYGFGLVSVSLFRLVQVLAFRKSWWSSSGQPQLSAVCMRPYFIYVSAYEHVHMHT